MFEIINKESIKPIGRVILFNINYIEYCANVGIIICEKKYWGKDNRKEVMNLILNFGLNLLNLNNIMLGTYNFNNLY